LPVLNEGISVGSEKETVVIVFAAIVPVIAFVGVIAAVALPAYQDYTTRVRLADVMVSTDTVIAAVKEYALSEQQWPLDNSVLGIKTNSTNEYVNSVIVDQGVIYVELSPESGTNGVFILVPTYDDSGFSWSCNESTVLASQLPVQCN
jgi:type IV pilus assembly protein PilA